MNIKDKLFKMVYILVSVACAVPGFMIAYWIFKSIGYQWTFWVCAVFVLLYTARLGHTVIEGLVVAAIWALLSYGIMKLKPEFLPIMNAALLGGAIIGGSVYSLFEVYHEERRQAREQREWQAYRDYVESLPITKPKADIRKCMQAFRTQLNRVWSQLPPELFELHDNYYQLIHTWLQRQFIRFMEKRLECPLQIHYGEYDRDYDAKWPEEKSAESKLPRYCPMEIWVNEKYEFHSLVSVEDGEHYTLPPFDHVLIFTPGYRYHEIKRQCIPFDQAHFELRPIKRIAKP